MPLIDSDLLTEFEKEQIYTGINIYEPSQSTVVDFDLLLEFDEAQMCNSQNNKTSQQKNVINNEENISLQNLILSPLPLNNSDIIQDKVEKAIIQDKDIIQDKACDTSFDMSDFLLFRQNDDQLLDKIEEQACMEIESVNCLQTTPAIDTNLPDIQVQAEPSASADPTVQEQVPHAEPLRVIESAMTTIYKCRVCLKQFYRESQLVVHYRTHTGTKPYQCRICGRTFSQKSSQKKHMLSHKNWNYDLNEDFKEIEDRLVYKCRYCKELFDVFNEFKQHSNNKHGNMKVYKCNQPNCTTILKTLDTFVHHIEVDHPIKQYQCHLCGNVQNTLEAMDKHLMTHTEEMYTNPEKDVIYYACTECNEKFLSQKGLMKHIGLSTHEFKCTICNRNFSCSRYLRRHSRKHKVIAYKCPICDRSYKSESTLRNHMSTAHNSNGYKCPHCSKEFQRKDKLVRHMMIHRTKSFKCAFSELLGCRKVYGRKDAMYRHANTHLQINKNVKHKKDKTISVVLLKMPSDATN